MHLKIFSKSKKLKAQSLIEFALILPLLLMIMFGIIELGRLLVFYSSVMSASREAARYGSAAGNVGGGVPVLHHYEDCAGIQAAAQRVGFMADLQISDIAIGYDNGPGTTITTGCPPPAPVNPFDEPIELGDRIRVQVTSAFQPILPIVNIPPIPITAFSARTIMKEVEIAGTPPPPVTPEVYFGAPYEYTVPEEVGYIDLPVMLTSAAVGPVTVSFGGGGGTALSGEDYVVPGSITIPSGSSSGTLRVTIVDDNYDEEDDEEFVVSITGAVGANVSSSQPTTVLIHITDYVDPPPVVSFTPIGNADEGDGSYTFSAMLSTPSRRNVTVQFAITGGTAVIGDDYLPLAAYVVVIPPLSTGGTIEVILVDDVLDEDDDAITTDDETIIFQITSATNADIHPVNFIHNLYINDNDDPPVVSFSPVAITTGETAGTVTFDVQLSAPSGRDVTVPYHIDAESTATRNSDYTISNGPVTIPAGETNVGIDINIIRDSDNSETNETVIVQMDPPIHAIMGPNNKHTTTISGVTTPPTVWFSPANQSKSESSGTMVVDVRMSTPWISDVQVDILPATGTATVGSDYTYGPDPVIIPAGNTSAQLVIRVTNDSIAEDDETIVLTMGSVSGGVKGSPSTHVATIIDDEPEVTVSFNPGTYTVEEDGGVLNVTLALNVISSKDVTVPFTVGGTATQGVDKDFTVTAGPVVIPAGQPSSFVQISVIDDTIFGEENETVVLTMGDPMNALKGTTTVHTTTIIDNDLQVCPAASSLVIQSKSPEMSFSLSNYNTGAIDSVIEQITVDWLDSPTSQQLETIKFKNAPIWGGSDLTPPSTLPAEGSWIGGTAERTLYANSSGTLLLHFKMDLSLTYRYQVTVYFDNGCPPVTSGN